MKAKPYVGVTGPVTRDEVSGIMSEFSEAGYGMNSPHIPMLGFLASYKTLDGQGVRNRRYPAFDDIVPLIEHAAGKALTMVHYNSREPGLAEQVSRIFDGLYSSHLCRSVQLNIVWPDNGEVRKIREKFPEMLVVFQASQKVIEGGSPKEVAARISAYGEAVSYVLVDPSGGRGKPFNIEKAVELYEALNEKIPRVVLGFAGGLTGDNVEQRVRDLISRIGMAGFCIDAEGGLRDKVSGEYGDDILNLSKVRAYLRSAAKACP